MQRAESDGELRDGACRRKGEMIVVSGANGRCSPRVWIAARRV